MDKLSCAKMLISVVMPAFNAEKTIGQAIQSVLAQTHERLELIVVDDGSADNTLSVAAQYAKKDNRVRVLKNETNSGVSFSRNHGVDEAKAEWVAFLDSDDMWAPDKLEIQCRKLVENPSCGLFYTGSAFMDEQGSRFDYILNVPEQLTYRELLKQNLIYCSSVLAKKEILQEFPMLNVPMIHEDFATWLAILKEEPCAMGIDEPLLVYRLCKSSKSGNKLRAARMQWRTYRAVGVGPVEAIPYFLAYAWRNVKKYTQIFKSADRTR